MFQALALSQRKEFPFEVVTLWLYSDDLLSALCAFETKISRCVAFVNLSQFEARKKNNNKKQHCQGAKDLMQGKDVDRL